MRNITTFEEFAEFCKQADNDTIIRPLNVGNAVYYFAFRFGALIAHYVDRDIKAN
jgi:hypothetical protein